MTDWYGEVRKVIPQEQMGRLQCEDIVRIIERAVILGRADGFKRAAEMAQARHDRELSLAHKEAGDDGDLGRACAAKGAAISMAGFALALESQEQRERGRQP